MLKEPAPFGAGSAVARQLLAILVLVSGAYFYNSGSWAQNARFDPIFSFVEPGPDQLSFRINRYIPRDGRTINTGDWSYYGGNFYSNKAPGTSFLGVPIYALFYHGETALGLDPSDPRLELFNLFALNFFISVLPLVLAAIAFYDIVLLLGGGSPHAFLLSALLFFATPLFPYSTQLWGHPTAAASLTLALKAILLGRTFRGGLFTGFAVVTDFIAGFLVPGLLWVVYRTDKKAAVRFILGGVPMLVVLLGYNTWCFGSPFSLPTDYTNPKFIEQEKALGLFALPSLTALWQLTFGLMRGLFAGSPVLLLSLYGWRRWFLRNRKDPLLWCSAGSALLILAVNASFNGWHGGSTVSPRYLIASLPFWVLPLKELQVMLAFRPMRFVLAALAVWSCANMLIITAVSPLAPDQRAPSGNEMQPHENPLYGWAYPSFVDGRLAVSKYPARLQLVREDWPSLSQHASWNLGQVFGLSGLASLVPFIALILVFLWSARGAQRCRAL